MGGGTAGCEGGADPPRSRARRSAVSRLFGRRRRRMRARRNGPRYAVDGVAPRWRDLEGFHTRFGDVRELLQRRRRSLRHHERRRRDARWRFPRRRRRAAGMVRDFVLVGDGWVKDGDYNTTASRTVLPLPTHASGKYVEGAGPAGGRSGLPPPSRRLRALPYPLRLSRRRARDALRGRIAGAPLQ